MFEVLNWWMQIDDGICFALHLKSFLQLQGTETVFVNEMVNFFEDIYRKISALKSILQLWEQITVDKQVYSPHGYFTLKYASICVLLFSSCLT